MKYRVIFFLGLLIFSGCYKESEYNENNINPDRLLISIDSEKDTLLANGSDVSRITVETPLNLKDPYKSIKLKTNNGIFKESDKPEVDILTQVIEMNGTKKRLALATLQSSLLLNTITIEASIGDVKKTKEIFINPNVADAIKVLPSALFMKSSYESELSIRTILSSKSGKVTPGQLVEIKVIDNLSISKGSFRLKQNTSNADGECTFVYSLIPDSTFTGTLSIIASTNINGNLISGMHNIEVKK